MMLCLTQAPLFSYLLSWHSSGSSRPLDPTLTPPHAYQPQSLHTHLSALETESYSDLEVCSSEMDPAMGKGGSRMGGTDYRSEAPFNRIFSAAAAAGDAQGEIVSREASGELERTPQL